MEYGLSIEHGHLISRGLTLTLNVVGDVLGLNASKATLVADTSVEFNPAQSTLLYLKQSRKWKMVKKGC